MQCIEEWDVLCDMLCLLTGALRLIGASVVTAEDFRFTTL